MISSRLLVKPWMQTCSSNTSTQFMQLHKFSFFSERCFQFKACIWAMKQLRWSPRVYISSECHNKLSIRRSSIKGSYRLLAFICLLGTKEDTYSLWTLKSWNKTLNHRMLEASSKSMEYNTILLVHKWREIHRNRKKIYKKPQKPTVTSVLQCLLLQVWEKNFNRMRTYTEILNKHIKYRLSCDFM